RSPPQSISGTWDNEERSPLLGGTPLKGRWAARVAVLVAVGLEQAAFFGITANLRLYLSSSAFAWKVPQASHACFFFLGASYLLSPVGGWLADVYVGGYGAMLLSFGVYLVAASLLPVTAWPDGRLSVCGGTTPNCSGHDGGGGDGTCPGQPHQQFCAPTIYTGFVLLALGVSSVRANLISFGAEQVKDQGGDAVQRLFNWFYWSSSVGAAFSLLVVAFVQQNIGFLAGYLAPVACLASALLVFLLATPTFISKPPEGSQVSVIIKLAMKSWGCSCLGDTSLLRSLWSLPTLQQIQLPPSSVSPPNLLREPSMPSSRSLMKTLTRAGPSPEPWGHPCPCPPAGVNSISHRSLGPPANQFSSRRAFTSPAQKVTFPEAWLLLPNVVTLVALVPLKVHVIDPFLARWRLVPSALERVALGMFFSLASILAAVLLERERLWYVLHNQTVPQVIGNERYLAAALPVWWQVPQFLLFGISEVFVIIPGLEFAYTEAPKSMKGATMGLFFFISGVGLLLGSGLEALLSLTTHGWMRCPEDRGEYRDTRV
ncbi:S15A3 protein, partial [Piaya cayana]|nr:S15A3 protein [Piaya cayana]